MKTFEEIHETNSVGVNAITLTKREYDEIQTELREALDGWKKQTEMYEQLENELNEARESQTSTWHMEKLLKERDKWKACAEELAKLVNSFRWLAVNSDNHKFPEYREMIDDLNRIAEVDITRFNKLKGETK